MVKIDTNSLLGVRLWQIYNQEIHVFCFSQMTHLQKVKSFYNKAAQYATLYFSEMQFTDEELSKIILSYFEDKKVG